MIRMTNSAVKITDDNILNNWYRKRRLTTIAGIIQKCIFSFEYSSVAISALYYFGFTFKLSDATARLYYSVTMAIMYFTATLSAMFAGRYMDRTRNLRRIGLGTIMLSIVGNVFYCLPFSKWMPILSRGLCGLADGMQPAIGGEFSRCYTQKELGKILSIYHILAAMCYSVAPCTPALFKNINFHIGPVAFNQYNFIGLFMSAVLILHGIFAYFFLSDLTKDPGYQIFLSNQDKSDQLISTEEIASEEKEFDIDQASATATEKFWTFGQLIREGNVVAVILTDGVLGYLYGQCDIVMNMIALYCFKWSITELSIYTFSGVTVFCIFLFVFQHRCLTDGMSYYFCYILCFVLPWMELSLMMYAINMSVRGKLTQIVLLESFLGLNIIYGFGSAIYAKWLLFSLVPAHSRSFVESKRYVVAKSLSCLGFFSASFVFSNSMVCMTIFSLICIFCAFVLMLRRNSYFSQVQRK